MKKKLTILLAAAAISVSAWAATPASFPGGENAYNSYIKENLKYPDTAKSNGIEGVVNLQFTVHSDGSIGNIKIKRMVDPDLEAEAIRLIKQMPAWTPANDNGTAIESTAEAAVAFTLE
ncbi:MAG: energy transducer TonB [Bacteroides sp.]|nr:energy transducer TonB [Bacteroides sp.]MBD5348159.1 energy transducer TonB [Bacteroides sp.]